MVMMAYMMKLSTRGKLLLNTLIPLIVIAIWSGASFYYFETLNHSIETSDAVIHHEISALVTLDRLLIEAAFNSDNTANDPKRWKPFLDRLNHPRWENTYQLLMQNMEHADVNVVHQALQSDLNQKIALVQQESEYQKSASQMAQKIILCYFTWNIVVNGDSWGLDV